MQTIKIMQRGIASDLRDLPLVARSQIWDIWLVDEFHPAGLAIAQQFGIPVGTLAHALTCSQDKVDPAVPFFGVPWSYTPKSSLWYYFAVFRNLFLVWLLECITGIRLRLRHYCNENGFKWSEKDYEAGLIKISQLPYLLEFPRSKVTEHFYYTTPIYHLDREKGDVTDAFPWDRLDGRPLVYASLGTVQNQSVAVYQTIAKACHAMGVQLVIALGKKGATLEIDVAPEGVIVADYAPQLQLIQKASLVISHCGLNTALESVFGSSGVPLLGIPISYDQPGVSARLAHAGVARVLFPPE